MNMEKYSVIDAIARIFEANESLSGHFFSASGHMRQQLQEREAQVLELSRQLDECRKSPHCCDSKNEVVILQRQLLESQHRSEILEKKLHTLEQQRQQQQQQQLQQQHQPAPLSAASTTTKCTLLDPRCQELENKNNLGLKQLRDIWDLEAIQTNEVQQQVAWNNASQNDCTCLRQEKEHVEILLAQNRQKETDTLQDPLLTLPPLLTLTHNCQEHQGGEAGNHASVIDTKCPLQETITILQQQLNNTNQRLTEALHRNEEFWTAENERRLREQNDAQMTPAKMSQKSLKEIVANQKVELRIQRERIATIASELVEQSDISGATIGALRQERAILCQTLESFRNEATEASHRNMILLADIERLKLESQAMTELNDTIRETLENRDAELRIKRHRVEELSAHLECLQKAETQWMVEQHQAIPNETLEKQQAEINLKQARNKEFHPSMIERCVTMEDTSEKKDGELSSDRERILTVIERIQEQSKTSDFLVSHNARLFAESRPLTEYPEDKTLESAELIEIPNLLRKELKRNREALLMLESERDEARKECSILRNELEKLKMEHFFETDTLHGRVSSLDFDTEKVTNEYSSMKDELNSVKESLLHQVNEVEDANTEPMITLSVFNKANDTICFVPSASSATSMGKASYCDEHIDADETNTTQDTSVFGHQSFDWGEVSPVPRHALNRLTPRMSDHKVPSNGDTMMSKDILEDERMLLDDEIQLWQDFTGQALAQLCTLMSAADEPGGREEGSLPSIRRDLCNALSEATGLTQGPETARNAAEESRKSRKQYLIDLEAEETQLSLFASLETDLKEPQITVNERVEKRETENASFREVRDDNKNQHQSSKTFHKEKEDKLDVANSQKDVPKIHRIKHREVKQARQSGRERRFDFACSQLSDMESQDVLLEEDINFLEKVRVNLSQKPYEAFDDVASFSKEHDGLKTEPDQSLDDWDQMTCNRDVLTVRKDLLTLEEVIVRELSAPEEEQPSMDNERDLSSRIQILETTITLLEASNAALQEELERAVDALEEERLLNEDKGELHTILLAQYQGQKSVAKITQ